MEQMACDSIPKMDWVEQRAERDRKLREGAERLSLHLEAALSHATKSYNRHYGKGTDEATCYVQYAGQILVARKLHTAPSSSTINSATIVVDGLTITATYKNQTTITAVLAFDAAGVIGFEIEGTVLGVEDLSEKLLTPVLFG